MTHPVNDRCPANAPIPLLASEDTTLRIISFTPSSVLSLREVSRALNQIGRVFLQVNQRDILAESSNGDSHLYRRIYNSFIYFSLRLWSHPDRACVAFQLSIPDSIRLQGVECPDGILAPHEIVRCSNEIQEIQDENLVRMWSRIQPLITRDHPELEGIPELNTLAQVIRSWMGANPNVLQEITVLPLGDLELTCVPLEIGLFTNLRELDLRNNQLTVLAPGVFDRLSMLWTLSLDHNQLHRVSSGAFNGLDHLHHLSIAHNQLQAVPPELFTELTQLKTLSLAYNRLRELPHDVFSGQAQLNILWLEHNHLRALSPDTFSWLGQMRQLFLNDNQLSTISRRAFNGMPQLSVLSYYNHDGFSTSPSQAFMESLPLRFRPRLPSPLPSLIRSIFDRLPDARWLA